MITESIAARSEDVVEDLDPASGPVILFGFTAAVLFVTGAVAILCFVTTWLMLGLVFGTHLVATVALGYLIARILTGRGRRQTAEEETRRRPTQTRPGARVHHPALFGG